jgi:V8-like Glu-specific endopeptidase
MTRSTALGPRAITAAVGCLAALSLSVPLTAATATAATSALTAPTAASSTTAAAAAVSTKGNATGRSPLTAAAKRAATRSFGTRASTAQALSSYWTPQRMRSATPLAESPAYQAKVAAYEKQQRGLRRAGRAPAANDGPARTAPAVLAKAPALKAARNAGGLRMAYNPNLSYWTFPAYTQGKAFFTMNGGNYSCSATIVNTEGKDTVWTAGHCVHGGRGGSWASNWTFVPAYDDDLANPRPYGTWSANQLHSRTAWTNSSDFAQDIGVATMNTNWGWHIVDYFGGQGFTVNRGKNVWVNTFGYPGETPFDGGNLNQCWGGTSAEWDAWLFWSQTVKVSCDMNRGASGGGWFFGWNGNSGWLNGVNSRADRVPNATTNYSPYFDDDAWSLFSYTRYM